ncbi:MAG TPA: hypothetical protein ENK90_03465 [Epsilonproteobacteria bacterium]|nr:hypothetical protein [Campylobacterota bacterium]
MRNLFENIAVLFVILLSLIIIGLIVKYNMIEDDSLEEVSDTIPVVKKVSKEESTGDYLNEMEHYSDVDVKVDPTQQDNTNRVVVKSEQKEDAIKNAVESKNDTLKTSTSAEEADPEKLEKNEIDDEVGMAIDAVLNE